MKLSEIKNYSSRSHRVLRNIDWWEHAGLWSIAVDVEYEFDDGRYHIYAVTVAEDTELHDVKDEDAKVLKILKKGTELTDQPFFTKKNELKIESELKKQDRKSQDDELSKEPD